MQKRINLYLSIAIFLCSLFSQSPAEGLDNQKDRTFYAITSLKFHLQTTLSDRSKDSRAPSIHFDDSDIAHLWLIASDDPSIQGRIQKAQSYYYASLNHSHDQDLRTALCSKSHAILKAIWKELNPYISKESATDGHLAHVSYPNMDHNPYLTSHMRKEIRPHLLPLNHPLQSLLDQIFQGSRVIQNEASFANAGFITLYHQPFSGIRVARHASLPGYLVKLYLDSDPYEIKGKACWKRLLQRCIGAENIRKLIKRKNLIYFSVPDKWLYPPPISSLPFPARKGSMQPVILIVTDMDIVSTHESVQAWLYQITPRHLDELYCILSHGFASEFLCINIPYCKNGKFACIDTEEPKGDIDLEKVKNFLSPEMQAYWDELVKKGGKI
jgi:hypothetical protein